jgi:Dihydrodipicolinate synthase/N-acetylneuraminate lyase
MVELTAAAAAERMDEARELNLRLVPLFKSCFIESNPIPVKAALSLMGFCMAEMRMPLTPATPSTVSIMKKTIEDLGI